MQYINWLAVIIATIAAFMLAYFWYSPALFGNRWRKEVMPPGEVSNNTTTKPEGLQKMLLISFALTLVYCYMLAKIMAQTDFNGMADGLKMGFMTGLCFSAMTLGNCYLFAKRSKELYLIDAGYIVTSSTLMGIVLGSM